MSYDVHFELGGDTVVLDEPLDIRGGTYALGGTHKAWLNITYNYAPYFARFGGEGIRSLYGKTASDVIPLLHQAIADLGTEADDDYWKATPGNAGTALRNLLTIAEAVPSVATLQGD